MKLMHIQKFIDRGYDLVIREHGISKDRPYHALVIKGRDTATSHNHLGRSAIEALESLERYLASVSANERAP